MSYPISPKELQELVDSFKAFNIEPNENDVLEVVNAIQEEFLDGEDPRKPVYLSMVELFPGINLQ
jgi:hypothetical protein